MKELILKRVCENRWGTRGVLIENDDPICLTLERPWANNLSNESCVPPGPGEAIRYRARRGVFPKHGETFEITGVPGRTSILFHRGNYSSESLGCVLLGSEFGEINGQGAILNSGAAFSAFYKHMAGINEFQLTVLAT